MYRSNIKSITISLLTLLISGMNAWAGEPGVKLLLRSGKQLSFSFKQKPVVKTTLQELTLSAEGKVWVSCPYADVLRIEINDDVETGITPAIATKSASVLVNTASDAIVISGLPVGETVTVCTIDGRATVRTAADTDGRVSVSRSALSHGIHIITTGSGISYKFYNH